MAAEPCLRNARDLERNDTSVVVLFPERSAFVASHPRKTLSRLAQVEQENADLRRYVVDLALQIQNLKSAKNSPRHICTCSTQC
jgi:hypothetical protein